MRKEILTHFYAAHIGVQATLRRARETVFWPHPSADVKNASDSCNTCKSLESHQSKQPLQSHDIIGQPWPKVGADLFSFADNEYLIIVDYLTNFWEVDNLGHDMH